MLIYNLLPLWPPFPFSNNSVVVFHSNRINEIDPVGFVLEVRKLVHESSVAFHRHTSHLAVDSKCALLQSLGSLCMESDLDLEGGDGIVLSWTFKVGAH